MNTQQEGEGSPLGVWEGASGEEVVKGYRL